MINRVQEKRPLGFASPPKEPTIEWDEEVLRNIEAET